MKLLTNVLMGVGAVGASSLIMENIIYSKSVASPKKKDENPDAEATEDTVEAADTVESFNDSAVEVKVEEEADEIEAEATEEKVEAPANTAESETQQGQPIQAATFDLNKLADLLVKTNYPAENVSNYINWLIANAAVPAGVSTVTPEPVAEKVVIEPVQPAQGEVVESVETATKKPSTKKPSTKKSAASTTKVTETVNK